MLWTCISVLHTDRLLHQPSRSHNIQAALVHTLSRRRESQHFLHVASFTTVKYLPAQVLCGSEYVPSVEIPRAISIQRRYRWSGILKIDPICGDWSRSGHLRLEILRAEVGGRWIGNQILSYLIVISLTTHLFLFIFFFKSYKTFYFSRKRVLIKVLEYLQPQTLFTHAQPAHDPPQSALVKNRLFVCTLLHTHVICNLGWAYLHLKS